ncbi:MAG: pyrroline-5-carboxylate reductase [Dissulfuribacterales bacterium]
MQLERLGFIGAGQMAEALIKGILAKGLLNPSQIAASEPSAQRRNDLQERLGIGLVEENKAVAGMVDVLVLAVKPQVMMKVLTDIGPSLTPKHLLISIAAGVTTQFMESMLPDGTRVVRVMPNTPALVQAGASALCAGRHASPQDLETAKSIFDAIGKAVVLPEELLNAVTGLSGSGPAYVFTFIQGLIDAGVREGLSRDVAAMLAVQTVFGSALMCLEIGKSPAELTAMVTSPGGTTIEGLYALENRGFRATIMDAVRAATERSRSLSKSN